MKILEVRDGIIKLECDDKLSLSSFIKADGYDKSYIAQIIQLKPALHVAYAKILFLYDGGLKDYDKTLPSEESVVTDYTSEMIKIGIKYKTPVVIGKTIGETENLAMDISAFDKKTLVVSDDVHLKNLLIKNLAKQFNNSGKKVVIIDTLGTIKANKYVAGRDFKLPLNKTSLKFIFEECLNDATAESKSMIVEIFRELAEYSQTVPFVPFAALKNIVDELVDHSHVFKLLVLKNKLSKYDKLGYFANTNDEVQKLKNILNSDCVIVDLSLLDAVFQNRYVSYLYEEINDSDKIVLLELSNLVSKKTLKTIFDSKLITTFTAHSKFKYISDITNMFDNFILFPSESVNRLFCIYSTFLRSMENGSYLVVGEGTGYMPFVLKPASYDAKVERHIADDEILEEIVKDDSKESSADMYDEKEETSDGIIAEINEKSLSTINDIAKNLESPESIEMFGDDNEEDEDIITDSSEFSDEEFEQKNNQEKIIDASEEEELTEQETVSCDTQDEDISEEIVLPDETESLQNTDELESDDISDEEPQFAASEIDAQEIDDKEIVNQANDSSLADEELEIPDDLREEFDDNNEELVNELQEEENVIPESETTEITRLPDSLQERDVIPLIKDDFDTDEIVELNPEDVSPDDILIDMSSEDETDEDEMNEQIKKEVDKVYTTRNEEDFSENDLDFIDELNNEVETLEKVGNDDGLLEELAEQGEIIEEYHSEELQRDEADEAGEILETRSSSTPIVPVYDAEIPEEDLVESDSIQQGDSVTHVRFGTGVVEKLVKYGSKTLFMINFDNGGRRLLDPLLTEIKKA